MNNKHNRADVLHATLEKFSRVLGNNNIIIDSAKIAGETENTLGCRIAALGILYPENTRQVIDIVAAANECHADLYPVSRGENIGYGEKTPVRENQFIMDLRKMNAIRAYDPVEGTVTVEPGVTQKQLYGYLREIKAPFRMDATGAGLSSSIIGNSLEGGFGHTPKGNRRETITDIEIVLGNGNLLRTGTFPGLGPDLSGLFVQSNFGIVTAAKVALMPIPELFVSFVVSVHKESNLEHLIAKIQELRMQGILPSLVHIGNALRSFMTTRRCPEAFRESVMTGDNAIRLMSSSILRVGHWSAVGGLYGIRGDVRSKMARIRKTLGTIGRVTFFTDARIAAIMRISGMPGFRNLDAFQKINESLASYHHIHNLMQGIPSDEPLNNIVWRVPSFREMGLIWYAPVIPADPSAVRQVIAVANKLFTQFRFELPVTLTFVTPSKLVGVISIHFPKQDERRKTEAYELYYTLKKEMRAAGIEPYRHGILAMNEIAYAQEGKRGVLKELKKTFDPNGIIAPGRYNI